MQYREGFRVCAHFVQVLVATNLVLWLLNERVWYADNRDNPLI